MPTLRKPTDESFRRFLAEQSALPFTYFAVGATATTPPVGYVVDRTDIELGRGERTFLAAQAALQRWEHFRLGFVEPWPGDTPIHAGEVVAILGRAVGLWWLNACRIVYVVDEPGPIRKYGFAYGTLPGHAETGEELFQIVWDRATDIVRYEILAFSRPHLFLAKLGYPAVRRLQKRFGRDSTAAMLRAVQATG